MLHHTAAFLWPSLVSSLATGGFLGVDVFFVLSGFLITVLLLNPGTGVVAGGAGAAAVHRRLGRFYIRRIRRLVPALAGLLGFLALCALVFHSPAGSVLLKTVAWVLSYLGNWVLASRPFAPEVAHTWSLSIEGQFYLAWPLVMIAVLGPFRGGRGRVLLAGLIVAGIGAVMVWRADVWGEQHNPLALYIRTPARVDALLVGCLAGLAVSSGWITGRSVGLWRRALVVGGVGILVLAFRVKVSDGALFDGGFTAVAVLSGLVVLGALFAGDAFAVNRVLASRPFVAVGRWSYSLYLWHFPIFYLLHLHQPGWQPMVRTAVGWALASGVAIASYRFVESPLLHRRHSVTT